MKRIGHAVIKICELSDAGETPLQPKKQGKAEIGNKREPFVTNLDGFEVDQQYHVVYERTQTITGKNVIDIHDKIDDRNS